MDSVLSLDLEDPLRYLLADIIVWIGDACIIQFVLFGDELIDAVILGVFGGLAFGAASHLLGEINGR